MTPKEETQELIDLFYWIFGDGYLGNNHILCTQQAINFAIRIHGNSCSECQDQQDERLNFLLEMDKEIKGIIEKL